MRRRFGSGSPDSICLKLACVEAQFAISTDKLRYIPTIFLAGRGFILTHNASRIMGLIVMSRKIKEFIEIRNYTSLDHLIDELIEIRSSLPSSAEPEMRMKGDDVFGRLLSISYLRLQTPEEAACDARYAEAYRAVRG